MTLKKESTQSGMPPQEQRMSSLESQMNPRPRPKVPESGISIELSR
jgi:hypothetical protein